MKKDVLNRLPKETRENIISMEGQIRELHEEQKEIDKKLEFIDSIDNGDLSIFLE